jgi:predicted 3-demethylubiquinone-9 3-methyltransferase (glyoxalase superfamily)
MSRIEEQKITPFLWFDKEAEDAAKFYISVFKNSKLKSVNRYDKAAAEATGQPEGSVLTIEFELEGMTFVGLNAGPQFKFSEAISFVINCETQEEVDYFWNTFTKDGEESMCGWLKDKYGLSWQVIPTVLNKLLQHEDKAKAKRAMQAMLKMRKLDIKTLESA